MENTKKVAMWTEKEYLKYIKDPANRIKEVYDMAEIAASEIGLDCEHDDIRAWIHDTLADLLDED